MKTSYLCLLVGCFASLAFGQSIDELKTSHYFETIKTNPKQLLAFLRQMPKGGDLHTHVGGASLAENLLLYGERDALCIDKHQFSVKNSTSCLPGNRLNSVLKDATFYQTLIDQWSMRHFVTGKESGHDHFFNTFDKFMPIVTHHMGDILSEMAERAALQNEIYIEAMVPMAFDDVAKWNKTLQMSQLDRLYQRLLTHQIKIVVPAISAQIDYYQQVIHQKLGCGTAHAKKGCEVSVRYLYEVFRDQPPAVVFAQLLAGFAAAKQDPRIVGINMSNPEDAVISMRDYPLHMRMIRYLHRYYPHVHVSLHAGELTSKLVPKTGLKNHIYTAIHIAKAERIGHGIDINNEDNHDRLLAFMAKQQIMVEINLTSNDIILGVKGKNHPLLTYLKNNVPVALSTDDEGINRSDLTHEYMHAVAMYHFSYPVLKQFARNSIHFSFLPGKRLWQDKGYTRLHPACLSLAANTTHLSKPCQRFLQMNEKAALEWRLEKQFREFESSFKYIFLNLYLLQYFEAGLHYFLDHLTMRQ